MNLRNVYSESRVLKKEREKKVVCSCNITLQCSQLSHKYILASIYKINHARLNLEESHERESKLHLKEATVACGLTAAWLYNVILCHSQYLCESVVILLSISARSVLMSFQRNSKWRLLPLNNFFTYSTSRQFSSELSMQSEQTWVLLCLLQGKMTRTDVHVSRACGTPTKLCSHCAHLVLISLWGGSCSSWREQKREDHVCSDFAWQFWAGWNYLLVSMY